MKKLRSKNNFRTIFHGLIVVFYLAIISMSIVKSPLFGDDWPNSFGKYWSNYFYGESGFKGLIIDTYMWTESWKLSVGRFFPINLLLSRMFILIDNLTIYKYLQLLALIVSACTMSFFIKLVTNNLRIGLYSFFIFFIVLQNRIDYDPIIGFSLIFPISTTIIFLSYIVFLGTTKEDYKFIKSKYFFYTLICVIATLIYEYNLLFIIAFPLIYYWKKIYLIKNIILTWLFPSLLMAYSFIILRPNRIYFQDTYEINLNLYKVIRTFVIQFISPFPLNQLLFGKITPPNINFLTFLFIILVVVCNYFFITNQKQILSSNIHKKLYILAIFFLIIPPTVISINKQWQSILDFGNSYLPVFFQYIGLAIILTLYFSSILINKKFYLLKVFLIILITILFAFQNWSNFFILQNDNYTINRKNLFISAINFGLFNSVDTGNNILSFEANDTHEINRGFISYTANKDLSYVGNAENFKKYFCNIKCTLADSLIIANSIRTKKPTSTSLSNLTTMRPPTDGVMFYNGNRKKSNFINNSYFLQAFYYQNGAVVYSLQKIKLDKKKIYVDFRDVTYMWVRISDKIPVFGTVGYDGNCIVPPLQVFRVNGNYIQKVTISSDYFVELKESRTGQIC